MSSALASGLALFYTVVMNPGPLKRQSQCPVRTSRLRERVEAMTVVAFVASAGACLYCFMFGSSSFVTAGLIAAVIGAILGFFFGPRVAYLFIP